MHLFQIGQLICITFLLSHVIKILLDGLLVVLPLPEQGGFPPIAAGGEIALRRISG